MLLKWRKFRVATTDSIHGFCIAPNLLNREFDVDNPSKVWVSDITYIHTKDGFLYLTVVIDLYDRKVIGWSYSRDMTAQNTTVAALRMAVRNRKPSIGIIIHSDRGVQCACGEFVDLIKENKMVQSMSRKGNCWDNAVAESFFKSLKTELIYGAIEMSAKDMETEFWTVSLKRLIPGLQEFFYLQHHYDCKPFPTQIIYKSNDKIKLDN